MGRAILCLGNISKTPYYLQKPGINIYSVEELCFCIHENTIFMDEEMVCRELIDWLRDECGLSELADSLYGFLKTKASVSAFLGTILDYTGYYPQKENKRIEQFLKESAELDEYEKKKNAADYMAGSGRYQMALLQYYQLLNEIPKEDVLFRGRLFHSIGYIYGQMFSFERAADFFEKAYKCTGGEKSLEQYLAARRLQLGDKGYIDFIASKEELYELSMHLEKKIEQLTHFWQDSVTKAELAQLHEERLKEAEDYETHLAKIDEQIKEQYRMAVKI